MRIFEVVQAIRSRELRLALFVAIAADTIMSADQRDRARCITSAPSTAPQPKPPSSIPYPTGLPLMRWAMDGSKARRPLAKNIVVPARSSTMRTGGEERTYRIAATVAPVTVSGGVARLTAGFFQRVGHFLDSSRCLGDFNCPAPLLEIFDSPL